MSSTPEMEAGDPTVRVLVSGGPRVLRDALRGSIERVGAIVSDTDLAPMDVLQAIDARGVDVVIILGHERQTAAEVAEAVQATHPEVPVAVLADGETRRSPGESVDIRWIGPEEPLNAVLGLVSEARGHRESPEAALLTRRQRHMLQLVAEGRTTAEIAEITGIVAKTVNNHLGAVYARLGCRNLTQAVLKAARLGIIDLPG